MSITILPKEKHEKGSFNLGKIKEHRPIVLSEHPGSQKPYSNIFYWAHAWSEEGSLLEEHPHQGFEIMSFVLRGEIEHYDSENKTWKPLNEGSAQVIRSGRGITHAEKFKPNSEIFQIWFDPGLQTSLNKNPSYDDYRCDLFPVINENNVAVKIFAGDNSPAKLDTPGINIKEFHFPASEHILKLKPENIYSIYLLEGKIKLEAKEMNKDDFAKICSRKEIRILVKEESRIFMIESPAKPEYKTYVELRD